MRLRGRGTDDEGVRDLGVRLTRCEEPEHFGLARAERLELGARLRRLAESGELLDHAPCHGGRERRLTAPHDADRIEQVVGGSILQQEAGGARAQRRKDVLIKVEGRQNQDASGRLIVDELPGRCEPVQFGHPDVHEDHVRAVPADSGHRDDAIRCLCDDLHIWFGFDQGPQARPDHPLVVGDHDADHALTPSVNGRLACTRQPPPGRGPRSSRPP